jgi:hypothetical protein
MKNTKNKINAVNPEESKGEKINNRIKEIDEISLELGNVYDKIEKWTKEFIIDQLPYEEAFLVGGMTAFLMIIMDELKDYGFILENIKTLGKKKIVDLPKSKTKAAKAINTLATANLTIREMTRELIELIKSSNK